MILSYQEFRLLKEDNYTQPEDISYDNEIISELLDIIESRGYITESDLADYFEFIGEEYGLELEDVSVYEWLQDYTDLIDETSNQNGRIFSLTNRGKSVLNEEGGIKGAAMRMWKGKAPEKEKGLFQKMGSSLAGGVSGLGRGLKDMGIAGINAGGQAYGAHVKAKNKMDARAKRHEKFQNWQGNRQERKMAKINAKRDIGVAKAQYGN